MQKIISTYIFSWALGFLLIPTAYAETNMDSDYRIPLYDKLDFTAEQSGPNKVAMNWSAFKGQNDEVFEYYKVIRSFSNPNPVYPEDNAMAVKSKISDLNHTDENAWRSAYYRVCAITDVKSRHCSNVVWIEIEKMKAEKCTPNSQAEHCVAEAKKQAQKEAERKVINTKKDEAKIRLDAKKKQVESQNAKQKETGDKNSEKDQQVSKEKQDQLKAARMEQQEALYKTLYAKLDMWLENFGARLEQSDLSSVQKVQRIEMIQTRFETWKQGKAVRIKMVDYLDKTLNEWKEKYSVGNEFEEIDAFLEGLLD